MATKLIAREEYVLPNHNLHYKRGEVFVADDELLRFLMADSPGCFAVYTEPTKAVDAPPVDKMLRKPKAKK